MCYRNKGNMESCLGGDPVKNVPLNNNTGALSANPCMTVFLQLSSPFQKLVGCSSQYYSPARSMADRFESHDLK
jgi:hypothetical protein